jgi:hypothetical protein
VFFSLQNIDNNKKLTGNSPSRGKNIKNYLYAAIILSKGGLAYV